VYGRCSDGHTFCLTSFLVAVLGFPGPFAKEAKTVAKPTARSLEGESHVKDLGA